MSLPKIPAKDQRIILIVPYGVEESGLIVFAERLYSEFRRKNVYTSLLTIGSGSNIMDAHYKNFSNQKEIGSWLVNQTERFDIVFWLGFFQTLEDLNDQIDLSALLKSQGKRIFFLWERTGNKIVVPDKKLLDNLTNSATNGFFLLNEEQYQDAISLSLPSDLIHMVRLGVDTHHFKPVWSKGKKTEIQRSLNLPVDKRIVLWMGRFVERKRLDFLINTWIVNLRLGHVLSFF